MPVIIFILDNSASMNQMTHIGTSLFDLGKGAIDQFFKVCFFDILHRIFQLNGI